MILFVMWSFDQGDHHLLDQSSFSMRRSFERDVDTESMINSNIKHDSDWWEIVVLSKDVFSVVMTGMLTNCNPVWRSELVTIQMSRVRNTRDKTRRQLCKHTLRVPGDLLDPDGASKTWMRATHQPVGNWEDDLQRHRINRKYHCSRCSSCCDWEPANSFGMFGLGCCVTEQEVSQHALVSRVWRRASTNHTESESRRGARWFVPGWLKLFLSETQSTEKRPVTCLLIHGVCVSSPCRVQLRVWTIQSRRPKPARTEEPACTLDCSELDRPAIWHPAQILSLLASTNLASFGRFKRSSCWDSTAGGSLDAHLQCCSLCKTCTVADTKDEPYYKSEEREPLEARKRGKSSPKWEPGGDGPHHKLYCCSVGTAGDDVDVRVSDPYVAPGMNVRLTTLGGRIIERQSERTEILIVLARETCVWPSEEHWFSKTKTQQCIPIFNAVCGVWALWIREVSGDTQTHVKTPRFRPKSSLRWRPPPHPPPARRKTERELELELLSTRGRGLWGKCVDPVSSFDHEQCQYGGLN